MIEFDNVFKANISDEFVEIRVGRVIERLLQDENLEISDDQVEDVKILRFEIAKYRSFLGLAIALGIDLQNNYGIDLGFEIEENENDENDE